MSENIQTHKYLSELIAMARQKKGWSTLKELFRERNPHVDYQTWRHAESGRRIPHPKSLLEIATILDIPKEDLIIAYCKDKFSDAECHQIVDSFLYKKFIDIDTLLEANHHHQDAHLFTSDQINAMQNDIRIRLFLSYTYDRDLKTTVSQLANFFNMEKSESQLIVDRLKSLDLIDVDGEIVTRRHRHMTMPITAESFELRKNLLIAGLQQNIKNTSHISNFHLLLSEDSFKKIMAFIFFAEANFLKLTKQAHLDTNKRASRIQIAIAVNRIDEGVKNERNE